MRDACDAPIDDAPPGWAEQLSCDDALVAASGPRVVVATKKLAALKRGASLSIPIGTSRSGPGDLYAPDLNCSVPTKPYEGYRTADQCRDQLSWTGTLKITRTS